MRSIRTKRRHAGRPTPAQAAALLAFVLLVAYLAAATSVGNFIAESIVAPIFTALGSAQSEASEEKGSVQAGLAPGPRRAGSDRTGRTFDRGLSLLCPAARRVFE